MPKRLAARALQIAPGLAGAAVSAAWPGTRPMAPDGMPLAGQLEDGLWVHGGHGSIGMMAAPATARWLVDAMLGGEPPSSLLRLSPARFEVPGGGRAIASPAG
jgi:glycine/D-amino acid oxidase-like deaminating enzyme